MYYYQPYFIEEETDIPSKWKSQELYLGSADCKVYFSDMALVVAEFTISILPAILSQKDRVRD